MSKTIQAKLLYRPSDDKLRFLPEGPYPLDDNQFSWVAIQCGPTARYGAINVFDWKTKQNKSYELPGRPGFAFPTKQTGVFVVGCEREIGLFSIHDRTWRVLAAGIDSDREGTIINDGVVWEDNLIFGTKDLEFRTKKAGLYLYRGRDHQTIRLLDNQVCSNGKAITKSSDGKWKLFDIDSPTRKVVAYEIDVDTASISEPVVCIDLTADQAVPDGMILTPDEKSVIISMYNPNPADHGETRQYRLSDGTLECVWETQGSPQNTCPQLVRLDGIVTLVITTALEFMPEDRRSKSPEAGTLFYALTSWKTTNESPVFQLPSSERPGPEYRGAGTKENG